MRHGKKINSLSRKPKVRKALLTSLAKSLIKYKRIITTLTRAKSLRPFIEPIITKAKIDTMHRRRQAFRHFQDKHTVKTLFNDISLKVGSRPGGYTRIIQLGQRLGDAAHMALIELVDYNENLLNRQSLRKNKQQPSSHSPTR